MQLLYGSGPTLPLCYYHPPPPCESCPMGCTSVSSLPLLPVFLNNPSPMHTYQWENASTPPPHPPLSLSLPHPLSGHRLHRGCHGHRPGFCGGVPDRQAALLHLLRRGAYIMLASMYRFLVQALRGVCITAQAGVSAWCLRAPGRARASRAAACTARCARCTCMGGGALRLNSGVCYCQGHMHGLCWGPLHRFMQRRGLQKPHQLYIIDQTGLTSEQGAALPAGCQSCCPPCCRSCCHHVQHLHCSALVWVSPPRRSLADT